MLANSARDRFEQLDGLRAVAVLGVVVSHTLDPERHPWAQDGAYGVHLFFVLSGFLITGILMDARRDAEGLSWLSNCRVLHLPESDPSDVWR